jgi:hypothetical protein
MTIIDFDWTIWLVVASLEQFHMPKRLQIAKWLLVFQKPQNHVFTYDNHLQL